MLLAADVVTAAIAIGLIGATTHSSALLFSVLPVWLLFAKLLGLYDRDHRSIRHLTLDEAPSLAAWAAAGVVLTIGVASVGATQLPVGLAVLDWMLACAAAVFFRGLARWLWRRTTPPERTVVIGSGPLSEGICRKIELFTDMHMELVAREHENPAGANGNLVPRLEAATTGLDRIIVAMWAMEPEVMDRLAIMCRRRQLKLSVLSPLRGRAGPMPRVSQVADLPVLECNTWDVSRSTGLLKRGFDVAVASFALLLLAPLFPLVALAIRLDSPGPIIFRQRRAGQNGREFMMLKLRTMCVDAETRLCDLVALDQLDDPMFKIRGDPRITRVGRYLRRISVDELPQLVNVLRGEMSIVGPRPEQVELVQRYRPEHRFRLNVRPGMTGPMQVFGRGELTFAERLAVELDYVENLSLSRDLRILFQTFPVVARGTGAF